MYVEAIPVFDWRIKLILTRSEARSMLLMLLMLRSIQAGGDAVVGHYEKTRRPETLLLQDIMSTELVRARAGAGA